ncbi:CorA family divalent cation transporter [Tropicimonas isoalkanivorans]|uniref:Magnesium transporter n=1 Tax=Tropicimonas isoalkanivorans TaxID=441112 RepID=A0A1I1P635_9RHOB|nr:CorA family divalent cation transporter [Tropicimonas isoalkanivorans]SFD05185.1 magnesium transporter [Tropicimonas isoalkanivorans]
MLLAHRNTEGGLRRFEPPEGGVTDAVWIDLLDPQPEEVAQVEALGIAVPRLADMEEIQISSRLYREGNADYITVVLPGVSPEGRRLSRPVCFILSPERLVTVRYHAPEPFDRYAASAARDSEGPQTPSRVAMGLVEGIVGQLADTLEDIGSKLDATSLEVFEVGKQHRSEMLQQSLVSTGYLGERIGRVRLSLLTLERALNYIDEFPIEKETSREAKRLARGQSRDIAALEVHADFLSQRVSFVTDATLGLIDLEQNKAVSVLSALVALFAPATLIASIYGMNFRWMPGLHSDWGVIGAVALMIVSAAAGYLYFKRRGWL